MFNTEFIQLNLQENNEKRFGLPNQPKPTCPIIDQLELDLSSWLLDTGRYPYVESKLEEIRENALRIRLWGQSWKEKYLNEIRSGSNR